jgi:hypothetical protein
LSLIMLRRRRKNRTRWNVYPMNPFERTILVSTSERSSVLEF